ncbi:fluoride efflux transporter CrcB [Liquorilactobacillus uvarum]|uniref:Fluoride-specific ion channel FluC n=1 Tax=Liquorilactobacillus uvarum DSM 19971 TaxID=1423812 RepID=A0A0R1Q4M8_9LACO|nr:fluoride efflux transporter CrcB [Liquorilactobacillus uvarum]KRL37253.1 hypothetical protein FD20_GL000592 [Liquorilactobacillus uvarum DSM 19971]
MIYLIGFGAAIGSLLRFEITTKIKKNFLKNWPLATFLINLTGAFLLGFMFGIHLQQNFFLFFGTGIVGGFTTFSTLNAEIIGLFNNKKLHKGLSYMVFSYLGGFALLLIGFFLGKML